MTATTITIESRIAELLELWVVRRQLEVAAVERGLGHAAGWLDELRSGQRSIDLRELDAWLTVLGVSAPSFLAALAGLPPGDETLPVEAEPAGLSRRELEALLRRVQDRLADLADLTRAREEADRSRTVVLVDELP